MSNQASYAGNSARASSVDHLSSLYSLLPWFGVNGSSASVSDITHRAIRKGSIQSAIVACVCVCVVTWRINHTRVYEAIDRNAGNDVNADTCKILT